MINLWNIFVVLLMSVVCSQALDYSEIRRLGIACPHQDSCLVMSRKTFTERNCECDLFCRNFHDCCLDARSPSQWHHNRTSKTTCMDYGDEKNVGIYVVSSCPHGYKGPRSARAKCQSPDERDPLFSVPVTETTTGVTYRNRYCAECNSASPHHLRSWLISANFETLPSQGRNDSVVWRNVKFQKGTGKWGVWFEKRFHPFELGYDKPSYITRVRQCRSNVISSCPSSWSITSVKQACKSYMSVVYAADGRAFRNSHCAVCNRVAVAQLSCTRHQLFARRTDTPSTFSFASLLDVNFRNSEKVGIVSKCPRSSVYDPFKNKCRQVVCFLPGYGLVNGKCKKN